MSPGISGQSENFRALGLYHCLHTAQPSHTKVLLGWRVSQCLTWWKVKV